MFKKKWTGRIVAGLAAILVVSMPKIIDWLFSVYFSDFTALKIIDAHDVMGYIGAIFGGVCALIAVVVAAKQFSAEKRPIIFPQNKIIYFYRKFNRNYSFQDSPDIEKEPEQFSPQVVPCFIFENISNCAATAFNITVDYHKGEWYREVCNLIGGTPNENLDTIFESDRYPDQGVFSANSSRKLAIPLNIEYIVQGISYRLYERGRLRNAKRNVGITFYARTIKLLRFRYVQRMYSGKHIEIHLICTSVSPIVWTNLFMKYCSPF